MESIRHGGFESWYQPTGCAASRSLPPSHRDLAHEAYLDAVGYLKNELRGNEELPDILSSHTTIEDVKEYVNKAKEKYERLSKENSVQRWLRAFSARIMYYGQVLDVLSQHHPEYVALAWGAVKFVLTGILNHANLVSQFSKALAKIGNALREAKLSAELYQIDDMKEAIARLFAHIILFFQQAVSWYNKGPAGRAWSSIFRPFELHYQDTVEEIKLCAQTVNDIANRASRAEIRDMHTKVNTLHQKSQERNDRLSAMQSQMKEIQESIDSSANRVLSIATSNRAITEAIHIEVLAMNPRLYDIQFKEIMQILRPKKSPEETLVKVQSLTKAVQLRRKASRCPDDLISGLEKWVSGEGSSMFLVRVGVRAEEKAREFAADVIKLLKPLPFGIIWNLSWNKFRNSISPFADMIKCLIFQALELDPSLLQKHPDEINIAKFMASHTDTEWATLFTHLFSRLSRCFVIIEAEDVFQAQREDLEWPRRFLKLFQNLVDQAEISGNLLKVLLIGYHTTVSILQSVPSKRNRIVSTVQAPILVPPRMRKLFLPGRRQATNWRHMKPRF